jgi:hypothetical protein
MFGMTNLIVWDIETVPDLKGFAAANDHDGKSDDEVRAEMGDRFPKQQQQSLDDDGESNGRTPETFPRIA